MGGVDVGGGDGKKQMNAEINMIPFIDLLLVIIAFLLLTAVWVNFSRINANAQVPGPPDPNKEITPETPEKVMHLYIRESEFGLVWKQGSTTVSESTVDRPEQKGDDPMYPDLAIKLGEEWKQHGGHQDASDRKLDQAILHSDNGLKFGEIVAVLDALYATKREMAMKDGKREKQPVFNMTFSVR